MIMAVETGAGGPVAGLRPVWEVLVPGFAFAVVFALGAARFRPVRRTRRLAYILTIIGAVIGLLSLVFGFERWTA